MTTDDIVLYLFLLLIGSLLTHAAWYAGYYVETWRRG